MAHAESDADRSSLPPWVEREFRAYLTCGILAHGFARARCGDCARERIVPFSCKMRGVCPSCTTRRMVEVAAHLVDHVLPVVPARQFVLSVPKRLRPFLHHRPEVATGVLHIMLRALRTTLVGASPGTPRHAQAGAISFFHRFGASLNRHPHFHLLVLDGVFFEQPDGSVRFHEATALTPSDVEALTETLRRRSLRYFHRHGILDRHVTDDMLTWQGNDGFSLDGSVRVEGPDRAGLERLVRYLARPPFALERLHPLWLRTLLVPGRPAALSVPAPGHRRQHRSRPLPPRAAAASRSLRAASAPPPPPIPRRSGPQRPAAGPGHRPGIGEFFRDT